MNNKIYHWFVKSGTIQLQKNGDRIELQLKNENGKSCLLTPSDVDEITEILFNISREIWENPDYIKKSYTNQIFEKTGEQYSWNLENSELCIAFNESDNAVEIKSNGNNTLNLELNEVVEIVQILEQINK